MEFVAGIKEYIELALHTTCYLHYLKQLQMMYFSECFGGVIVLVGIP